MSKRKYSVILGDLGNTGDWADRWSINGSISRSVVGELFFFGSRTPHISGFGGSPYF